MKNNTALMVVLGGCGYLFYRYSQNPDGVSLADDLLSTIQTGAEMLNQTDIPFSCVDPKTGEDYTTQIKYSARMTGVPALLLAALIRQESGFNARVVNSSSGAMGLGQFMPATAAEYFGSDWSSGVFNPERAIHATARYLAWLYRRHGTWRFAVAAYNWGTGNVAKYGLAGMPNETRNYVKVIYDNWSASLPA